MKLNTKFVIFACFLLLLHPCIKSTYPENSILGIWRYFEESAVYPYRQYDARIEYHSSDSTVIKILNLYNLNNIETYATVQDTLITIIGTYSFDGSFVDFSGTGHIERDFSAIYWRYSYSGMTSSDPQVEAAFRRP